MPELPEVETIVRQLKSRGIEGKKVIRVRVNWPRTVEPLTVAEFCGALTGNVIEKLSRTGKWIILALDSGRFLMIHLRMSGSFSMSPSSHDRIVMELSDGWVLYYRDTRKFGRWRLVNHPAEILASLGPDALSRAFSRYYFHGVMTRHKRMIKPLLLDQSIIAGLGNIYVDEALWEASIHPERLACSLSTAERELLFRAIKHVLRIGVRNRGTSLGGGKTNYRDVDGESGGYRAVVKAYGRSGKPCARCATGMVKIIVAQRGTHICPKCQLNRVEKR